MSDTTTITPEERALWASVATARINAVTPERLCEITAQERLVKALIALEQAEAENARLKAQRRYLANALSSYGDDDEEMSPEDWERSAHRAVAAEEE